MDSFYNEDIYKFNQFNNIFSNLDEIISGFEDGQQKENIQTTLRDIQKYQLEFEKSRNKISELQKEYIDEIDKYLTKIKPFVYSKKECKDAKENADIKREYIEKEVSLYRHLIKHSMIANDFYLLQKWCIDIPFEKQESNPFLTKKLLKSLFIHWMTENSEFVEKYGYLSMPYVKYLLDNI